MKQKLLLLAISFIMALSTPLSAITGDGINFYLASDTTATVTGSIITTGEVVIPKYISFHGNIYKVTVIGDGAFDNCTSLTSITIPNSVTSIGGSAFLGCTGLTSITIPNSVTSIGSSAFLGCTGLTSITIPNSVTSICSGAFQSCSSLTSVTIGNNVTSIGGSAFRGCYSLTSVTIPNSVTSIGNLAFSLCSGLTSVTIPNSVTSIDNNAFEGCTGLASMKVELGNTEYDSRDNCNAIIHTTNNELICGCKNSDIPNSVTNIGKYAFSGCSGLTSVTIPNSVTRIGSSAFYDCRGLTSITIPNSVTSIGSSAFDDCRGLTSITIPNSVSSIGDYAFNGCNGLTSIIVPNSVISIGTKAFQYCTGKLIVNCDIKDASSSQYSSSSENGWFSGSDFSSVEIGGDVTSIGSYAFYGCTKIQSLTIGSNVTRIGSYAFNFTPTKVFWLTNTPPYNYSIANGSVNYVSNNNFTQQSNTKVYPYLSSLFEVNGVKYIPVNPSERTCDAVDYDCHGADSTLNINSIVSYKGVALSVRGIGEYFANNNTLIKDLTVGDGITSIGNSAFYGCSSTVVAQLGQDIKSIGSYAFSGCDKLDKIIIPDATTSIGEYCFNGCSALKEAVIGDSVAAIRQRVFYGCTSLESITIGDEVKSIGQYAFGNCSNLSEITIPSNVNRIDSYVFYGNSKLADVVIADRKESLSLGVNYNNQPLFSDCPLDSIYIGGKISYSTSSYSGYSPFYRNTCIRTVVITDEETEIYQNEFYGCTNLKNVKIGDGVQAIDDYAFSGCSSLEEFTFGSGLKTIGKEAFSDCSSLKSLTSKAATPPTCGNQALDDINKWNCTLYVPNSSTEAYKTADQWKEFFFVEAAFYYVNYYVDGEIYLKQLYKVGEEINSIKTPRKTGYNFAGWSEIPDLMPAHDVDVYASFTVKSYTLTYMVDDEVYKSFSIEYGATIIPEPDPIKEGYTFSGWDHIPNTMPANDVEVNGYFDINNYILLYKVDGELYKSFSLMYGTAIVAESNPTKEGYTFSGWSEIPTTMPAHDVEITGTFTINTYKVELNIGEGGTASVSNTAPVYGSSVELVVTPNEGYEVASVVINNEDMTEKLTDGSYTIENIQADVSITVTFTLASGLDQIQSDPESDTVYDLSGSKVQQVEKGRTYIRNGKKILVK